MSKINIIIICKLFFIIYKCQFVINFSFSSLKDNNENSDTLSLFKNQQDDEIYQQHKKIEFNFLDFQNDKKEINRAKIFNIKQGIAIRHKIPQICILAYYDNKTISDNNETFYNAKIDDYYVSWLQSGGSLPIPLMPWLNITQIDSQLDKCNGVLFQGKNIDSDLNLTKKYHNKARLIYEVIKIKNQNGTYLPLFGIGSGANLIQIFESNRTDIVFNYAKKPNITNLEYNPKLINFELLISDVRRIRMWHYFDGRDSFNIQNKTLLPDYNQLGVSPNAYIKNNNLKKAFKIIGLSNYENTKENFNFISIFEAYKFPIYGIHFNPAKYIFDKINIKNILDYSNDSITICQKILNIFVKEAYKNLYQKVSAPKGMYSNHTKNEILFENEIEGMLSFNATKNEHSFSYAHNETEIKFKKANNTLVVHNITLNNKTVHINTNNKTIHPTKKKLKKKKQKKEPILLERDMEKSNSIDIDKIRNEKKDIIRNHKHSDNVYLSFRNLELF